MKVTGLDRKVRTWKWKGCIVREDKIKRSSFHLAARALLKEMFPMEIILEEVPLPGTTGLSADFFVPTKMIMVETHGRQHYEFIPHFHTNWQGFLKAKQRDRDKQKWCEINKIKYVELPYNEDKQSWTNRIIESLV